MCEVCTRKSGTDLVEALRPFLREDIRLAFTEKKGWQELLIVDCAVGGKTMKVTADGDQGGYFHWENIR